MARAEAIQPSRSTGKPDEIEKLMSGLGRGCRKSAASQQLADALLYRTHGSEGRRSQTCALLTRHIAMRMRHAEQVAGSLSADTPEREHARAVIIEQVERLH